MSERSLRRFKLVGGIAVLALAFAAYALRSEFSPTVFLLQTAGSYLLGSLGSDESWQQRIGIVLAVNSPLLLYLIVHP